MRILITGGMGFIGINASLYFANAGHTVTSLDNFNKIGLLKHIDLVKSKGIEIVKGDIRDWNTVEQVFSLKRFDVIIHLAGQTAVTKSIEDPLNDFQNNAVGTFNMLEAYNRSSSRYGKFIYASTNKVYGSLPGHKIIEKDTRYELKDTLCIEESEPLDFHSPYGCSKGCADQYVRDYHRIYELNTNVVRQSCIYGPYQDGTEDQGWIAWFIKAFLEKSQINVYGTGKQVRDVLHVSDLIKFYELLIKKGAPGEVYNIGGGPTNALSINELIALLINKIEEPARLFYSTERPGDQKVFISNNSKAYSLGWKVSIPADYGIEMLIAHFKNNGQI
jgi:CDP-paratose 2-epimerase